MHAEAVIVLQGRKPVQATLSHRKFKSVQHDGDNVSNSRPHVARRCISMEVASLVAESERMRDASQPSPTVLFDRISGMPFGP